MGYKTKHLPVFVPGSLFSPSFAFGALCRELRGVRGGGGGVRQDKTRQNKTRYGGLDKTRQDKTRQDKTRQ